MVKFVYKFYVLCIVNYFIIVIILMFCFVFVVFFWGRGLKKMFVIIEYYD